MGGEQPGDYIIAADPEGSPPHGRGKGAPPPGAFCHVGITPAWAGKSSGIKTAVTIAQDHPRMGGEKTKKIP